MIWPLLPVCLLDRARPSDLSSCLNLPTYLDVPARSTSSSRKSKKDKKKPLASFTTDDVIQRLHQQMSEVAATVMAATSHLNDENESRKSERSRKSKSPPSGEVTASGSLGTKSSHSQPGHIPADIEATAGKEIQWRLKM